MLKYDSYYFQCPNCQAWLEGRNLKSELVNEAILYSDGKVLYDNYITTRQKMILCPSCGHAFWVESPEEPFITFEQPHAAVYYKHAPTGGVTQARLYRTQNHAGGTGLV